MRQTEDRLVIAEQDQVIAVHELAERPYQRRVIHAHFQDLKARRDRRLQQEAEEVFSRLLQERPVLAGPEVEKRSLSVYEELA